MKNIQYVTHHFHLYSEEIKKRLVGLQEEIKKCYLYNYGKEIYLVAEQANGKREENKRQREEIIQRWQC